MAHKCKNRSSSSPQVSMTKNLCVAMISKINLISRSNGWWIDTQSSLHVFFDLDMFKTHINTKKRFIWDSHITNIVGTKNVYLRFNFQF